MLDCCEPLEKVKATGISFGKLVCLAHCSGARVEAFRTNQSTIDDFRKYVMACSSSDDCHVISSYHRGSFQQVFVKIELFIYLFDFFVLFLQLSFYVPNWQECSYIVVDPNVTPSLLA
ncbi:hypothetical protein CsSME_00041656 [Camellia sinensis var. sinensis]